MCACVVCMYAHVSVRCEYMQVYISVGRLCVYLWVHKFAEARGQPQMSFSRCYLPLEWEEGSLIDLELTRQAWLASSKTQRSACFHYFRWARATTFSFLLCILRIKLRLSSLCSKHFTNSGPSPAFPHTFVGLLDAFENKCPPALPPVLKALLSGWCCSGRVNGS